MSVSVILAAMNEEVDALKNRLADYEETTVDFQPAWRFFLRGEEYLLMKGRIGKVNTAMLLARLALTLDLQRVFNIGTTGGIHPDLKIGDVVVATKVGYYDVDLTIFDYAPGQLPHEPRYYACDRDYLKAKRIAFDARVKEGIILSGDNFLHRGNIGKFSIDRGEVMCCDMESAAVGQVCTHYGIPFLVIRSISDLVFEDFDRANNDADVRLSSSRSASLLWDILRR